MRVSREFLNPTTPIFVCDAPESDPIRRAWGMVRSGDQWIAPAYYPFGLWVAGDIQTLHPRAAWGVDALEQLRELQTTHQAWSEIEARTKAEKDPLPNVPDDFFPQTFLPFQHQRYGIARVRYWPRSFFLWEMRTGKTRTLIDGMRLLALDGKFEKALVLGPPVVLAGWIEETARATRGEWKAVLWDGTDEAVEASRTAQIVLASYARIRLEAEQVLPHPQLGTISIFAPEQSRLRDIGYNIIIADESHQLGNPESDQSRAAIELSKIASRRYCLTGTAADNPLQVYGQLYFLSPGLVPQGWEKYDEKYVVRSPVSKHMILGYRNLNEINQLVDSVATRRKQSECLDLPERTVTEVTFDLGPIQRARYNEMVAEMKISVAPVMDYLHLTEQGEPVISDAEALLKLPHGATRIQKLLQVISGFILLGTDDQICDSCPRMEQCVEAEIRPYTKKCAVIQSKPPKKVLRDFENPKLNLFEGLVEQILAEDPTNKIVCWGSMTESINDMEKLAKKLSVGSVRLDGDSTGRVQELRKEFFENRDCRLFLGMISSGIGIDLSVANYMIYYDTVWVPAVDAQAMERISGPGQKRKMSIYRLLTSKATPAIDRYVASVVKFKKNVAFTMLEKVACATCDRQAGCALDGTIPFRENCKYAAAVSKPIAKAKLL